MDGKSLLPVQYFLRPREYNFNLQALISDPSTMQEFAYQVRGDGKIETYFEQGFLFLHGRPPKRNSAKQKAFAKNTARRLVEKGRDKDYFRWRMESWLSGRLGQEHEQYPLSLRQLYFQVLSNVTSWLYVYRDGSLMFEELVLLAERMRFQLQKIQIARYAFLRGDHETGLDILSNIWGPTARSAERNIDIAEELLEWLHYRIGSSYDKRVTLVHFGNKNDVVELWNRVGQRCEYCHINLEQDKMHLDHIQPISRAGLDITSNWAISCKECNMRKSAELMRVFNPPHYPINFTGEERWTRYEGSILMRSSDWYKIEW